VTHRVDRDHRRDEERDDQRGDDRDQHGASHSHVYPRRDRACGNLSRTDLARGRDVLSQPCARRDPCARHPITPPDARLCDETSPQELTPQPCEMYADCGA
jgi:hypothetical protein